AGNGHSCLRRNDSRELVLGAIAEELAKREAETPALAISDHADEGEAAEDRGGLGYRDELEETSLLDDCCAGNVPVEALENDVVQEARIRDVAGEVDVVKGSTGGCVARPARNCQRTARVCCQVAKL